VYSIYKFISILSVQKDERGFAYEAPRDDRENRYQCFGAVRSSGGLVGLAGVSVLGVRGPQCIQGLLHQSVTVTSLLLPSYVGLTCTILLTAGRISIKIITQNP
jgi:hypothetical protein